MTPIESNAFMIKNDAFEFLFKSEAFVARSVYIQGKSIGRSSLFIKTVLKMLISIIAGNWVLTNGFIF